MNYKLLLSVFLLSTHVYSLDIYSEVSSTILSMKNIGDKVTKGEVIVQLDSRQAELELKAQEMILETKEMSLMTAKRSWPRLKNFMIAWLALREI